jgi:hypothetical protein
MALIRGTKNANEMHPDSRAYANGVLMEGKAERLFPARTSTSLLNLTDSGRLSDPSATGSCQIQECALYQATMQIGRSSFRPIRSGARILGISTSRSGVIGSRCCSLPAYQHTPSLFELLLRTEKPDVYAVHSTGGPARL